MDDQVTGKALNDATDTKAGDIYQYIIALRHCFELEDDDSLQIEVNGDVCIIGAIEGVFQKEVKHHFGKTILSDRHIDFWKTLANWYLEFDRIAIFSDLILSTTSEIKDKSPFFKWNDLSKDEKLETLKKIGEERREKEEGFRKQYDKIFGENYNESKLLSILNKFTIEPGQDKLDGISKCFSSFVGHIPEENRDQYIGALLGLLLYRLKDPPHKWIINRQEFERKLQDQSTLYGKKGYAPLPKEYQKEIVPTQEISKIEQKRFVQAIRDIQYEKKIPVAITDYWKALMTVTKYFQDDMLYLGSLQNYKQDLYSRMIYAKDSSILKASGKNDRERIKESKFLYNDVMQWQADDFGSITHNQGFFQRGVIHDIVNEGNFEWKIEDEDEY